MSSGGHAVYSFIPRCKEEAATLEAFEQRVELFVSPTRREERYFCGPRLLSTFDSKGDTFRNVRDNLTDPQLEAADGSGVHMIVKTSNLFVGPKSTQEGVRLLLDFSRLDSSGRNHGEPMRHWTRRFTLQLHESWPGIENTSNSEFNKYSLHEHIAGISLAETSGLTSSEFASLLATSGRTGAEGENISNSLKFSHFMDVFKKQSRDAALASS